MDCSSITDFQQSTAIRIAKKFRNLHIGNPSFSFPQVPQTRRDSWSVTPFPLHLIEAASSYQATRLPTF